MRLDLTEAKPSGEPGWKWRRLAIFPVVAFACWRLMMMENAPDTRLNDTIAWGWNLLIIVLVGGYTGFATAQDIVAFLTTRSALPYSPASSPVDPAVVAAEPGAAPCNPLQTEFAPFENERRAG
jgi:hypothetical protein